ncbi:MAG: Spy/CpxP family protein refolding chaperone [Desulfobacterales bacterium]|nr:MAG: Spy/CpxP family protein refolding chaperone [Desulfobacterales bacterium]
MVRKELVIALTVFLGLGLLTLGGCRHHSHGERAEWVMDYISEVLDLTDEQRVQLDQVKTEFLEKGRQMHVSRAAMYAEIIAQLQKEEIDQAHLKGMIADHKAKMDAMIPWAVERLAEFHRTLTPEQRAKLVDKLEDFAECHHYGDD